MPRIIACGGRGQAFRDFRVALEAVAEPDRTCMLLVDSEDVVTLTAWEHVLRRDAWDRPRDAADPQLQFMKTCMETWIVADRAALRRYFGSHLRESALPPLVELESRSRADIQDALARSTAACPLGAYRKGAVSFKILAQLDPRELRVRLPAFVQFSTALRAYLDA
jgi:hypothetical protein